MTDLVNLPVDIIAVVLEKINETGFFIVKGRICRWKTWILTPLQDPNAFFILARSVLEIVEYHSTH